MKEIYDKTLKLAIENYEPRTLVHAIDVSLRLTDPRDSIIGLAHDLIEDTLVTLEDLRSIGFDQEMIQAMDLLTHVRNERYDIYIEKISKCELADLESNMSETRNYGGELVDDFVKKRRLIKHKKAWKMLECK